MNQVDDERRLHDPTAPALPGASTSVKTTTCYMGACRCGIKVHLRDAGKGDGPEVRYIEGNPEHPLNKGILCAKGSAGIMKQYSPARLTQPLRRKPGSERGAGEFEPISWDETFQILEDRLRQLRATDPKQFAMFTGRDQMQALTGLFARQFGTPNYAAHGGFCSVNMAAGMIYTIGGSFWEFGGPDLARAKVFYMIGTAEDHHSNPMKAALAQFKRDGGRFVAINPICTGYAAIADEWVPIKPGTDGALMLAILMSLLGTIDRPGGFRHKAPYPRAVPPNARPPKGPASIKPNTPLDAPPLGWPESPEDLCVDADGEPVRIDKGFSWEYPLSAHGLMHNVITNAWRGDPYPIDTLLLFMANMAWNSSMNTGEARRMLADKHGAGDRAGQYKIPFIVVCDTFQSEMTAFADLILPDTSYLERHDVMSMLDRPISEFDGPCDSVRVPVLPPLAQCKPFQEVLVELAGRLKLPAFTAADGGRKYTGYPDFIVRYETAPGSGIGFLGGWRGADGSQRLRGAPNPRQWEMYAANNCVHHVVMKPEHQYMRNWNRGYMEWAQQMGPADGPAPRQGPHRHPPVLRVHPEVPPGRAGQDPGPPAARPAAGPGGAVLRPAALLIPTAGGAGQRPRGLPAGGRHAAADGDVPLLGQPERLASPDPCPQRAVRQPAHRQRPGHRRRRLAVG